MRRPAAVRPAPREPAHRTQSKPSHPRQRESRVYLCAERAECWKRTTDGRVPLLSGKDPWLSGRLEAVACGSTLRRTVSPRLRLFQIRDVADGRALRARTFVRGIGRTGGRRVAKHSVAPMSGGRAAWRSDIRCSRPAECPGRCHCRRTSAPAGDLPVRPSGGRLNDAATNATTRR